MKKKIIGTVVFLALAAAFLWKLNDIFSLKQEDGILPMEVFYEQEPGSIDVMFYGSSHTYSDINPAVLWEEAGFPPMTCRKPSASLEYLLLYERKPEISASESDGGGACTRHRGPGLHRRSQKRLRTPSYEVFGGEGGKSESQHSGRKCGRLPSGLPCLSFPLYRAVTGGFCGLWGRSQRQRLQRLLFRFL